MGLVARRRQPAACLDEGTAMVGRAPQAYLRDVLRVTQAAPSPATRATTMPVRRRSRPNPIRRWSRHLRWTFGDSELYDTLADWLLDLAGMEGGPRRLRAWSGASAGTAKSASSLCSTIQRSQNRCRSMAAMSPRSPTGYFASATLELRPHQVVMLAAERMPTGATGTSNGGAGRIAQPAQ